METWRVVAAACDGFTKTSLFSPIAFPSYWSGGRDGMIPGVGGVGCRRWDELDVTFVIPTVLWRTIALYGCVR